MIGNKCGWTSVVCSKYNSVVWQNNATPGKFCIFYCHLNLERTFPALKVTQIWYRIWTFLLLENCQFYHKLHPPVSPRLSNIPCMKEYPPNLKKYEINGTSKIQISQLFSEFRNIWKYNLSLYSQNPISIFFLNWEKLRSPARATLKNPKNIL